MDVVIREAIDGDAAALASLSTQLGYPADAETMRERLRRVRAQGSGCVFVAVDGEAVVGWTHVVERLQLEDAPLAEIAGLIVDQTVRGAGVGARLMRAAKEWARAQGYVTLRVRSNVIRERAHRFYVREGYVERKRQVVFEKVLVLD
jgi:GNAT superfamily N-acetyltransferase